MKDPHFCPPGYICNMSLSHLSRTATLSQIEPCPAGFTCNLNSPPLLCPHGSWCPEATATPIHFAGNMSSPQPCKDGIRCEPSRFDMIQRNVDPTMKFDQTGALSPEGSAICPFGYYCESGRRKICPVGTICQKTGLVRPRICPPGTYQKY